MALNCARERETTLAGRRERDRSGSARLQTKDLKTNPFETELRIADGKRKTLQRRSFELMRDLPSVHKAQGYRATCLYSEKRGTERELSHFDHQRIRRRRSTSPKHHRPGSDDDTS